MSVARSSCADAPILRSRAGGAVGRQRDRWSNDCVLARGPGDDGGTGAGDHGRSKFLGRADSMTKSLPRRRSTSAPRCRHTPSACRRFRGIRPGRVRQSRSRCDPTSGGHRSGSLDRRRAARQRLLIPAKAGIQNWRLNFSKYWVPVYAGTSDRERAFSTAGTGRRACPGCARGWAEGYEPHRPYSLARAQSRRPGGGSA